MHLKSFFLLFKIFSLVSSFNLCVVGGTSGLGRELVFQSLSKNKKVLALTNSSDIIKFPYRGIGLQSKDININMLNPNLLIDRYENSKKYNFENIVFTIGAGPFEKDYSDVVTKDILTNANNDYLKNIPGLESENIKVHFDTNYCLNMHITHSEFLNDDVRNVIEVNKNQENVELDLHKILYTHLTRFCYIDSIIYTPIEKTKFTDDLIESLMSDYNSLEQDNIFNESIPKKIEITDIYTEKNYDIVHNNFGLNIAEDSQFFIVALKKTLQDNSLEYVLKLRYESIDTTYI